MNKDNGMNTLPLQSSEVEWEYTYGGDEFDWFYDVQPTADDGYIATGITVEDGMNYAWLLKVDVDGEEEWSTVNYEFNGTQIEADIIVSCVRQTPDEGYLVGGLGRYYNTFHGYWFAAGYLWKVDSTGVTEWLKSFGNEEEEWYYVPFVFENYDGTGWMCGGFYLEGTPASYILDIALFKTDLDGNLLWSKTYDEGRDWEMVRSLLNTQPDDGYFLSGSSLENPNSYNGGFCMIKTDSAGNKEWGAIFDGPGHDFCPTMGCRQTTDGGYIMSGLTNSYGAGGTDLWIVKTDSDGAMEWDTTYGEPNDERNYGMDATDDGGYVFIVIKNAFSAGGTKEDTWIINTDSEGNPEWDLLLEEDGTQWPQSIVQTSDGGFIVAGRTGSIGNPSSDGMLLKVGPFPHLDLEITGGLGIEVSITNNGLGDAIGVPYELTVTGGILGLINTTITDTIDIDAGATETISSGLLFGLGGIEITVKVGVKEGAAQGTQFLIFSIVN
jgi:hypothetical protein